jgi:hypothetical protein
LRKRIAKIGSSMNLSKFLTSKPAKKELLDRFYSQEKLVLPLYKKKRHVQPKALLTRQRLDAHKQKQARVLS